MPLVKRPKAKDHEELVDFTYPMPREFVEAFNQLQTELEAFQATLPDGTQIESISSKLQAATHQKFLSYARLLKKEEKDFRFGPEISAYLTKHQPKPRLTPEQKKIENLKDKARATHAAVKKLQSEGAPVNKIQAKIKAYDRLCAQIKKLDPEATAVVDELQKSRQQHTLFPSADTPTNERFGN